MTEDGRDEQTGLEWQRCRSCRARILFMENRATQKMVPVQRVRLLYEMQTQLFGPAQIEKIERSGPTFIYVSHFELCPDAARFTRRKS